MGRVILTKYETKYEVETTNSKCEELGIKMGQTPN